MLRIWEQQQLNSGPICSHHHHQSTPLQQLKSCCWPQQNSADSAVHNRLLKKFSQPVSFQPFWNKISRLTFSDVSDIMYERTAIIGLHKFTILCNYLIFHIWPSSFICRNATVQKQIHAHILLEKCYCNVKLMLFLCGISNIYMQKTDWNGWLWLSVET